VVVKPWWSNRGGQIVVVKSWWSNYANCFGVWSLPYLSFNQIPQLTLRIYSYSRELTVSQSNFSGVTGRCRFWPFGMHYSITKSGDSGYHHAMRVMICSAK
jgi:hypothetical protein